MGKIIGFIGQGWVGKNYADGFEKRGYEIVRYSLEKPYVDNKEKIKDCDIVFIAVPTPTTPAGFDGCILRQTMKLLGVGKIAVIKSTMMPGTTELIQKENPDIYVMHSPEFLTEVNAAHDVANPNRNIIGIPEDTPLFREKAKEVIDVMPSAPYRLICPAKEAELIKYGGNCWFYFKVIFINMLYDLAKELGCQWETIRDAMMADARIGETHLNPIHKGGRGAGGHCFIKDFAAFSEIYKKHIGDEFGLKVLESLKDKNIDLLVKSGKDLDLLSGVYGEEIITARAAAGAGQAGQAGQAEK